ncbi:MAG: tRNA (adenosine(37)-N6)-threonylcarbamoyltransferase complex dimerization subunit type 1 TsaB [Anaerolineae bacterium]|nr:tRNA (adenosine(37)-N6)-threonylcarbamoyltransferase complex dimerization subunit type 1 TsaB [Anaerolineae bacterium]
MDTATAVASVALWSPYRLMAEETWASEANHTVELLPTIARLLERSHVQPRDLSGLAATRGPGSFTGVRIGVSLVKGLALALGIPLATVPTLDVIAYGQSSRHLPVRAVIQAGRGRLCWADYRWHRRRWSQQGEVSLGRPEDLVANVRGRTLFCGELYEEEVTLIQRTLGPAAVVASPAEGLRRAGYLAELAYRQLMRNEADSLTVSPVYLMPGGGVSV